MATIESLIEERLARFRADDLHLERTELGIREQRAALLAEIAQLETTLAVVRKVQQEATGGSAHAPDIPMERPDLDGLSIADSAERVLAARGGEAAVGDLLQALGEAGRISTRAGRHATLGKALERHPDRFEKAGRGRWRLVRRVGEDLKGPEVVIVT